MKIKFLLTFLVAVTTFTAYSQSEKYSFIEGKFTQHEISMTSYEQDSDAEALVIFEFGDNRIQGDHAYGAFMLLKNKKIKIKILKESGFKYADFEIPLYSEGMKWETLDINKAIVYNYEDNVLKKTMLDSKKVFEEKINDRWVSKKFTMPDVKEGSIIEIDYTITTPYLFNMGEWNFQKKIPVVYSKLKYKAIPYYVYSYLLKGANKFDEFENQVLNDQIRFGNMVYKQLEYVFGMKDVPAFKDEEFITSPKDYMVALNFQLSKIYFASGGSTEIMSTWPKLSDEFLKEDNFGKYIKKSQKEGKKIIQELGISSLSPTEQLEKIILYVKSTYSWNGNSGKFAFEKLSDFQKKKIGNSANINLYLVGLLQAANLDVAPVLVSTRGNGLISKLHPFESSFNYVVAMVNIDGEKRYFDATDPLLHYTQLPERCLNIEGLVIKPKSEEWVILKREETSVLQRDFDIKIDTQKNALDINLIYTATGYKAYEFRSIFLGKKENLSNYLKKNNNIDVIGDVEIQNEKELDKPFSFTFSCQTSYESTGDKIFVHPFCDLSTSTNPFKQAKRTLPLDMIYLNAQKYRSVIEIPKGYKVEFLPAPAKINNRVLLFAYSVKNEDGKIEVEASYDYKKSLYDASEYSALRNNFGLMVNKLSEMIVFVKED